MIRLRRPREGRSTPLDLAAAVRDDRRAVLQHQCPGSGQQRLLAVDFSVDERKSLRGGGVVAIDVRCDRCIWKRRVLFRLETL